jgi:desulfoferrodoxin (superoxide reductase-like protein)
LTDGLTRRRLLRVTGVTGAAVAAAGLAAGPRRSEAASAAPDDMAHRPVVRVPASAVGSLVPVLVTVPLAMTPDHYIRSIEVVVPTDPVPSKGRAWLTPACGEAYLYTQARVDEGRVEVVVTAECNRHGPRETRVAVEVLEGG